MHFGRNPAPSHLKSEENALPGIRTSAAAELLGVSPSTLRTWERRLGYPSPRRTPGNHRQYDLGEIESLREALRETGNISSAVDVAQRRGRGPATPARLVAAFDRFDEDAADRELEESLAVRSVERTVEEVLLPALDLASIRPHQDAELEHASRWAIGWLHSARRLAPPATRTEGILLLDSGAGIGPEVVETMALELFLRRAGLRVLLLSADLDSDRFTRALRALGPSAAVLCGTEARIDVLGPSLRRVLDQGIGTRIYAYRAARLVSGKGGMQGIGSRPGEATGALLASIS